MPKIKAILIDTGLNTIKEIFVENSFTAAGGMYEIMKTDIIEHGLRLPNDDLLLVDEEGTFKKNLNGFNIGYFKNDNTLYSLHILGNSLIVGSKGTVYSNCESSAAEIENLITFDNEYL